MSEKKVRVKVKELKTTFGVIQDLELVIGKVVEETLTEPQGPTPYPSVADLRNWDFKLMQRYKPFYSPLCDMCCFCTLGKCDLSGNKRGACGIDIGTQQGRMSVLLSTTGAACHVAHARHLVEHLIKKYGRDRQINLGEGTEVEAPVIRLVCGIKPRTLGDLEAVLDYAEKQVTNVLATFHTGQEGSYLDYESKALHSGMVDHVGMEVADIAQISAYGFPKGDPNAPLVDIGFGTIDVSKPVVLCIGHNVASSVEIVDYMKKSGLEDKVEICGICCTAHDLTRYHDHAKVVGSISQQIKFVRSGVADVLVVDEQCVRTDMLNEAQKVKTPIIAVTDKICLGLKDRTKDPVDEIVEDLTSARVQGVLILDPFKAGEVAVKTAIKVTPIRGKFKAIPSREQLIEIARRCGRICRSCRRSCPIDLPIDEALGLAAEGKMEKLAELYDLCLGCVRCESACRSGIPIVSLMEKAAEAKIKGEKYRMRTGRGPIHDVEIRNVGSSIVLGEIPGVIAFVGCPNYPNGPKELAELCQEFLKRRYIVIASGCSAMDLAMYKDEEGQTLYERYSGNFDAGCLINVGSCVSNAHIVGATIKIASIFARRPLQGNYEEIADYVLNRVGAVCIAWGAMSQKAYAIASGANRLGIPVIFGPHGSKYRRMFLGIKENEKDWRVYDARTGNKTYIGPAPEHLVYVAETKEEAIVMAAKLCIRPNDTTKGRAVKLTHYIDLHKKFYGKMPDDIQLLVRSEYDIPITIKDEVKDILKNKNWKPTPSPIPDPTLLDRMIRKGRSEKDD